MKIKAIELHCVAILATYWLQDRSKDIFKDEIKSADKIKKFCAKLEDDEEIIIEKVPF